MAQQINNTIYEKKHHYMMILEEINILKNQIEDEVLNSGLKKSYSIDIQELYVRTIIGLIGEGVQYEYIKNNDDPVKDIIRLDIDGHRYECKNIDIKDVLDDRYKAVMKTPYEGPSLRKIIDIKKSNEVPENVDNSDMKELINGLKEAITDSNKPKEQPKFDAELPTITLSIDDNKLMKKDNVIKRSFDTILHWVITAIIILAIIFAFTKIKPLNNFAKTAWDTFSRQFGSIKVGFTQTTTEQYIEESSEPMTNINTEAEVQ